MVSSLKSFVLLGSLLVYDGSGFTLRHPVPSLPTTTRTRSNTEAKEYGATLMQLLMAKKPGGKKKSGPGQNNNKKKKKVGGKKGPKQERSKKGDKKAGSTSSSPSRAAQMNNKKKQSSSAPPWQIVSKKDMKKNVEAEKQRRKLAQEGIHNYVDEDLELGISRTFLSPEDKAILAWKRFSINPNNDKVDFIGAYLNQQLPPRLGAPEVAFLGRSNVGKSSLLNKLVGSTTARVGKTPGATASVNLYGIFRKEKALLGLVDLPGFGYAKLSKETKESVQNAAEKYLGKRKELAVGVLLVDIRRQPSDDDRAVLAALYDMGVPIVVVATKVDKLSKNQLDTSLETLRQGLGLPEGQPLCVSSIDGTGIKDLWRIILEGCESTVEELRSKLESGGSTLKDGDDNVDEDDAMFEDGEDVAYSQGYDWIHETSSVMYEGGDDDFADYPAEFTTDDYNYEDEDTADDTIEEDITMRKETLKDLKKRAKDMELRGEL